MMPSPPRRALAMLTMPLLALALAGATTASASTIPPDPVPGSSTPTEPAPGSEVVIHDEGSGDQRVNLSEVPVAAGSVLNSVKTNESTGEIHMSGAETLDAVVAGTTTVEQTAEVTEVAADGGFTVIRTVVSYDFVVTEGPAELGDFLQDDDELEALVGIPLVQVYDADRILLSVGPTDPSITLTADQEAAIDKIVEDGADSAQLPDADLAVGATWTAFLQGSKGATAEFELVSLDAAEATISLVVDGDAASLFDPESPLQGVAGTVTGTGSMVVDLTNSLGSDTAVDLTVDMTGTTQGITFSMTLDSTMTNEVTAG
jgi:hypothetical protein